MKKILLIVGMSWFSFSALAYNLAERRANANEYQKARKAYLVKKDANTYLKLIDTYDKYIEFYTHGKNMEAFEKAKTVYLNLVRDYYENVAEYELVLSAYRLAVSEWIKVQEEARTTE